MATVPQQYTPEDTMALIQERAKVSGDRFRIQVYRRHLQTGGTAQVAGLDAATVDHIADTGRWLPGLLGGGEYILHVFHSVVDTGTRIGGALLANFESKPGTASGPAKAVPNIKFMRSDSWMGPAILNFPSEEQILAELGNGQLKRALGNNDSIPFQAPQPVSGGGVLPDYVVQREREIAAREQAVNATLAQQQKEIAAKEAEVRRIESESRLRSEMSQQTNELKNTLSHVMSKLDTPRAPDTSMRDIISALAPIVSGFMTSQAQMRSDMVKFEQENNRRREEAEARRAEAEAKRHDESLKMQMEVLKAQSVRPGMSDEMKMLIETLKSDKSNSSVDAMAAMMTRMVDAVGVVSKMSINMIETVAEQMGGDPEDPVVTAIKEGTKAMMMLTQGGQSAASRIVPGARQQPQAQQPRPATPPAQQAAPRPAPAAQAAPAAPVSVVARPTPAQPAALAGVPVPAVAAVPAEPVPSKMDLLERAIRGDQPPEDIARVLVAMVAQKEASLQTELQANENNPNHVIYARLGEKWIMEHPLYLKQLGEAFDRLGAEAGLFEDDTGEGALMNNESVAPDALSVAPSVPAPASPA